MCICTHKLCLIWGIFARFVALVERKEKNILFITKFYLKTTCAPLSISAVALRDVPTPPTLQLVIDDCINYKYLYTYCIFTRLYIIMYVYDLIFSLLIYYWCFYISSTRKYKQTYRRIMYYGDWACLCV